MSTTTSSDALAVPVRGYAQAVRTHLADLGPDVVEELTDGLEADLTEALLDDTGAPAALTGTDPGRTQPLDLTARFGPAAEYAAELRTAAGLPEAVAAHAGRRGAGAIAGGWSVAAARWREFWRPMTSSPVWGALIAFLRSLAPAWWILRGWVGAQVILWPIGMSDIELWPESTLSRILVVAAVVVSVQWGRGRWLPRWGWFPGAVAVASVAAALLAIPMVARVEADSGQASAGSSYEAGWDAGWNDGYVAQVSTVSNDGAPATDGVWVDGMQVSNLFAYDAAGDPIRDVQLFDDRGRPVRTIADEMVWDVWSVPDVRGSWSFQPGLASDGRARWNVFPLSAVPAEQVGLDGSGTSGDSGTGDQGYPVPPTGVRPEAMPWPFLKAPTEITGDAAAADAGAGAQELDEPDLGRPDRDHPASDLAIDRSSGPLSGPASDPAGGTVHPGESPAAGRGGPVPTLEATRAD